jgi:hypothetical protein
MCAVDDIYSVVLLTQMSLLSRVDDDDTLRACNSRHISVNVGAYFRGMGGGMNVPAARLAVDGCNNVRAGSLSSAASCDGLLICWSVCCPYSGGCDSEMQQQHYWTVATALLGRCRDVTVESGRCAADK